MYKDKLDDDAREKSCEICGTRFIGYVHDRLCSTCLRHENVKSKLAMRKYLKGRGEK